MRIHSWDVITIEAERFRLDGGAMFGVVPKTLWSKQHPADEKNRIPMVTRCLLARGEGRVVLVDTGMGAHWSDKERDIYAIENGRHSILAGLAAHGVKPADVTDVVLTHLHFDHAGGATVPHAGGATPAFPSARYHVQEQQLAWAQAPTEKDRRSYKPEHFMPLQQSGQLATVPGAVEILPGISVWPTEGHTPGHQVVTIGEGRDAVIYCGDLIPLAAHVPTPWVMSYDLSPVVTMREKRELLERAAAAQQILVMEHDPFNPAVRVGPSGDGFAPVGREEL
jgi:glyoxylase-like metal-dependent hydrolase (beta-lactamase superfamily II)